MTQSVGAQTTKPKDLFDLWNPHSGKKDLTTKGFPLTFTCGMGVPTHIHTINKIKVRDIKIFYMHKKVN